VNRLLRASIACAALAAAPIAQGYEWVKPTAAGAKVHVAAAPDDVAACEHLGVATATTADHVLGLPRVADVVSGELTTLARNRAAEMGGDTIVADGAIRHGTQNFAVYRCNS
jgi:uncharacterized protein DUF4156